eukprot:TRINITY_DN11017_c0_g1_i1.p1 TRINITY_DN11017_c0_g1~~TRINITY_DN11017_c0_g1_i1.p1  ORF type:complete len:151 (-),score=15.59 TRINITY_DN11017_c0_g1_i1:435-887(-)
MNRVSKASSRVLSIIEAATPDEKGSTHEDALFLVGKGLEICSTTLTYVNKLDPLSSTAVFDVLDRTTTELTDFNVKLSGLSDMITTIVMEEKPVVRGMEGRSECWGKEKTCGKIVYSILQQMYHVICTPTRFTRTFYPISFEACFITCLL